jgi:hypothetical protein
MGTRNDRNYLKSCNGNKKGQEMEIYCYKRTLFFSVKSLGVKTPEVPVVEFYHFSKLFTTASYKSDKKKTC